MRTLYLLAMTNENSLSCNDQWEHCILYWPMRTLHPLMTNENTASSNDKWEHCILQWFCNDQLEHYLLLVDYRTIIIETKQSYP